MCIYVIFYVSMHFSAGYLDLFHILTILNSIIINIIYIYTLLRYMYIHVNIHIYPHQTYLSSACWFPVLWIYIQGHCRIIRSLPSPPSLLSLFSPPCFPLSSPLPFAFPFSFPSPSSPFFLLPFLFLLLFLFLFPHSPLLVLLWCWGSNPGAQAH